MDMVKSIEISEKHRIAREWAEAGFYVFPVIPDGKIPLIAKSDGGRGVLDATRDFDQIAAWWTLCPEANIGCAPDASGHFVIDPDEGVTNNGRTKNGIQNLRDLEQDLGHLPVTFTVRTPGGGLHLWFKGTARSSTSRIAQDIDTRGVGGYVLLPGSSVDGLPYTANGQDIAHNPPAWVFDKLATKDRESERSLVDALDTDENIRRAERYLRDAVRAGDVAIEGDGGDDKTYQVAAFLHDIGISRELAVDLLLEHWNDHCDPPWSEEELTDETHSPVYHAFEYAQNEPGSKGLNSIGAGFEGITRNGVSVAGAADSGSGLREEKPARLDEFYPRDESEQSARQPPEWYIPGWLQHKSTVMVYGPPESFKSFIALDIVLSAAAGKRALGLEYEVDGSHDVVYAAGEGAIGIESARRPAWKQHRQISGQDIPFYSISAVPHIRDVSSVQGFIDAISARGIQPAFIVLDTLSRMLAGLNENDAADASVALEAIEAIRRAFDCTVIFIHHTGKDGKSERGSTVFRAGVDTSIKASSNKEAKLVTLQVTKQKDGEAGKPITLKGHKIQVTEELTSLAFSSAKSEDIPIKSDKEDDPDVNKEIRECVHKYMKENDIIGLGAAVTTKVLAHATLVAREEMPLRIADQMNAVRNREKALQRLAKKDLSGYIVSLPNTALEWALPA